jgi:hypothetical protein
MAALIEGEDLTVLCEPVRCLVPFVGSPGQAVQQEER